MNPVYLSAALAAAVSTSAQGAILDFTIDWSGASFGNSATATATISIDDSVFLNPGNNEFESNPGWVTAFSITVTGSTAGDGTWTLADFNDMWLDTDFGPGAPILGEGGGEGGAVTALDLTQELVGQPTSQDPWGTSEPGGTGGDFNMNPIAQGAPFGSWYFQLTAGSPAARGGGGGGIDSMLLTSFRPVPAPSGLALGGVAAGLLARRRRA